MIWIAEPMKWFCLRTRAKHESLAARHLRAIPSISDVFAPQIRFERLRRDRLRKQRVTEAMFPGYLFAQFDPSTTLRQARHAPGVIDAVRFGSQVPSLPDAAIEALRSAVDPNHILEIAPAWSPGERVVLVDGPLHGLRAVITEVLPGTDRVRLLLEFLGSSLPVEIATHRIAQALD